MVWWLRGEEHPRMGVGLIVVVCVFFCYRRTDEVQRSDLKTIPIVSGVSGFFPSLIAVGNHFK